MRTTYALLAVIACAAVGSACSADIECTFEMRLIPDGAAGSPSGAWAMYPIGDPGAVGTGRIGFWLQARVSQVGGENWGIGRACSPAGTGNGASFITVSDSALSASLSRGMVNAAGTNYGRGTGYRNGGLATGNTGNAVGSVPFPGNTRNENGGLDNGGSGGLMTRIYSFDAFLGEVRNTADPDNPSNPWGMNGSLVPGSPIPNGEFSPWANLYRCWVDVGVLTTGRVITLNASAQLVGTALVHPTDPGEAVWRLELGGVRVMTASYTFAVVPVPGAAGVMALGALVAGRRRTRGRCERQAGSVLSR